MSTPLVDSKGRPYLRDWTCSCGCGYTAEVLTGECINLSGEFTAWCPRCHKRPASGTPRYRLIDGDRIVEGEQFKARRVGASGADLVYDLWSCWRAGEHIKFRVNDGRGPESVGTIHEDDFHRLFVRVK